MNYYPVQLLTSFNGRSQSTLRWMHSSELMMSCRTEVAKSTGFTRFKTTLLCWRTSRVSKIASRKFSIAIMYYYGHLGLITLWALFPSSFFPSLFLSHTLCKHINLTYGVVCQCHDSSNIACLQSTYTLLWLPQKTQHCWMDGRSHIAGAHSSRSVATWAC